MSPSRRLLSHGRSSATFVPDVGSGGCPRAPTTPATFSGSFRGLGRRFAKNELAFLAFSSKVELAVRDRLAYALSGHLRRSLVVREWRRTDLAVLSDKATPKPLMLLEATAMYTFDLIESKPGRSVSPEKVEGDVTKLRATKYAP